MKTSYKWIDAMTTLGCFAVVCLHVNCAFGNVNTDHWWISNVIESLFYFGAPVFFMISGFTLIDYRARYDTLTFFKKRFLRTVLPFLFWSSLDILLFRHKGLTVCRYVYSLLHCSSMPIYWLFVQLFALYLVIPVLAVIPDKRKWYLYIIIYSFISISLSDFATRLLGHPFLPLMRNPLGGGAVTFALIGYWVGHYEVKTRYRFLIYCMGVICLLTHYFGTMFLTEEAVSKVFKGYMNWPSLFYSLAVFMWVRNHDWNKLPWIAEWMLRQIRECSLGIYLLHGFIVYRICPRFDFLEETIIWRIFGAFLIIPLLIVVIRFLRRLPGVRYVLP